MMSSRIMWWKRAKKSPYGVRGIECLMRDILQHTTVQQKACPTKKLTARQLKQKTKKRNRLLNLERKLRSKQRILDRKKRYGSQLAKEKKGAQTAKKMKRFLKRLKKYNHMMAKVLEEYQRVDMHLKKVANLMIEQKQLVATDIIKIQKKIRAAGTCAYCHKVCDRLSREHLLPRSAGGRAIIHVCFPCNFKRGSSGKFGPFLLYIYTYPDHWAKALASTADVSKTTSWLRRWDL